MNCRARPAPHSRGAAHFVFHDWIQKANAQDLGQLVAAHSFGAPEIQHLDMDNLLGAVRRTEKVRAVLWLTHALEGRSLPTQPALVAI
jgi:hypothetical protein